MPETANFSTMEPPRILIAGTGALGSVFGGMLQAAGGDVTLLGRPAHLESIARHGLRLSGLFGAKTIRGLALADGPHRLEGRFGLILCTVKSYDTEAVAEQLAERLDGGGLIVSMQNGLGNIEALAARFGPERALGARVIFGAEIVAPGEARVTVFADPVAVGPAPAINAIHTGRLVERAREVATLISRSGIPTEAVPDIMPVLWSKIIYNVALNPLGALLDLNYGALGEDPDLRRIMDDTIEEAFAVARASGVALAFADAAEYRRTFYERLLPSTFDHRPSMLYDLRVRGRTEIEALNGKVVEIARSLGLDAPTNGILTQLVRASERIRRRRMSGTK